MVMALDKEPCAEPNSLIFSLNSLTLALLGQHSLAPNVGADSEPATMPTWEAIRLASVAHSPWPTLLNPLGSARLNLAHLSPDIKPSIRRTPVDHSLWLGQFGSAHLDRLRCLNLLRSVDMVPSTWFGPPWIGSHGSVLFPNHSPDPLGSANLAQLILNSAISAISHPQRLRSTRLGSLGSVATWFSPTGAAH